MKTIKGLDDQVTSFEEIPPTVAQALPTYRKIFKACIGMLISKTPEESIDLYQLGLKFTLKETELQLEESEFMRLKLAVEKNLPQYISHMHAQALLKLKESELAPNSPTGQ